MNTNEFLKLLTEQQYPQDFCDLAKLHIEEHNIALITKDNLQLILQAVDKRRFAKEIKAFAQIQEIMFNGACAH